MHFSPFFRKGQKTTENAPEVEATQGKGLESYVHGYSVVCENRTGDGCRSHRGVVVLEDSGGDHLSPP
jgi:hypothetical protein